MLNYREILRLRSLDYSQRQVAASVRSSRSTISEVYQHAKVMKTPCLCGILLLRHKVGMSWRYEPGIID
jgi:hypothetical protein